MSTHDEHAKRYQAGDWKPKVERGIQMQNPPNDIPVIRVETDFGATEPDNIALYIPKSQAGTSLQPRFINLIPPDSETTRNLQTLLYATASDTEMRRRSYKQLSLNASQGDECASAILEQFHKSGLTLD